MQKIPLNVEMLQSHLGERIGSSDWMSISQERIDLFADATEDWGWIHVNPERAKEETAFAGSIAHGFLILSLVVKFLHQILDLSSVRFGLNYGLDKVRFISPVRAGAQVRMHVTPKAVTRRSSSEVLLRLECEMEIKGSSKLAMVAQILILIYV